MMKGLLVYTKEDAEVNRWFIGHLLSVAGSMDVDLRLVIHNDAQSFDVSEYEDIDLSINRTRFCVVNEALEARNIPCFNNYETVRVANDKWQTYLMCRRIGVPVLNTRLLADEKKSPLSYPCVLKSRSGHGGKDVFWIENKNALDALAVSNKEDYILQEAATVLGLDVRVYVLGDKVIAGVKRTSDRDFRSNFSLGGQVELFEPAKEQLQIISAIQKELSVDYAGFDFILHKGHWVLNEIEDAVGARMLYSLCDYDIGEAYIKHIINILKKAK